MFGSLSKKYLEVGLKNIITIKLLLVVGIGYGLFSSTQTHAANTNTVVSGDMVAVEYIGMVDNGVIFDTNIKNIAQKAGIYQAQSSYIPLMVTLGQQQMIPGFERAIIGMKKGQTKKVTIQPKDAYGNYDPYQINIFDVSLFTQSNIIPKVGDTYQIGGQAVKIIKIDGDNISIDANHPLAGKILTFIIRLKSFAHTIPLSKDFLGMPQGVMTYEQRMSLLKNTPYMPQNNAVITMIEYSDPACPFCIRQFNDKTVKTVRDSFPGKIQYIYKPVQGVNHETTQYASEAILCAGKLGGKSAYKSIYEGILGASTSDKPVATGSITPMAKGIGLDTKSWSNCIAAHDMQKVYEANWQELLTFTQFPGTPSTLIINNKNNQWIVIAGAYPVDTFKSVVATWLK